MACYHPSVQTIHRLFLPHTSQISYLKYGLLPPLCSTIHYRRHFSRQMWLVTTNCPLFNYSPSSSFSPPHITNITNMARYHPLLCSNYLPSSSFFSLTSLQLPDQPLAVTLLVTFLLQEGSLWSQKLGLELFLPLVILPCNSTLHHPTTPIQPNLT